MTDRETREVPTRCPCTNRPHPGDLIGARCSGCGHVLLIHDGPGGCAMIVWVPEEEEL